MEARVQAAVDSFLAMVKVRHQRRPSPRPVLAGVKAIGAEGVGHNIPEEACRLVRSDAQGVRHLAADDVGIRVDAIRADPIRPIERRKRLLITGARAIVGARVVPVSGPALATGTVVFTAFVLALLALVLFAISASFACGDCSQLAM